MRKLRRFSLSEDRVIRAGLGIWPLMSIAELAAGFERTRMTVYRRAVKLGLTGPDRIIGEASK